MGSAQAETSWLVPLRVHWNGLNPKEIARRDHNRWLDTLVMPLFGLWYLVQASAVVTPGASLTAATAAPVAPAALLLRGVLAAVAAYAFLVHAYGFPAPVETQEAFIAQTKIGRWVYLTRHCLALQAWHQVLSLFSNASPWINALTHGMCIWISALGCFVTIQYFALVVPSTSMKEECQRWRDRGVQFQEVGFLVHITGLPVAVLDLLFAKSTAELGEALSMTRTVALATLYSFLYLGIVVANYQVTLTWPYGLMNDLGTSIRKWAVFIAKQVIILEVFVLLSWLIVWFRMG